MPLAEKKCVPCEGGVPPLSSIEREKLLQELTGWQIEAEKKLAKVFKFSDFKSAMDFATKIAAVADKENHHPDLFVKGGELKVELWTHAISGLSENDFILASKIDAINGASSKQR